MQNGWEYLRQNKLAGRVWPDYDAILGACRSAWHFLVNDPERVRSIGNTAWACVNP
jgi:hypothetical protein